MSDLVYRARGYYIPTGKESYVTTVWRRTKEEAEEDIEGKEAETELEADDEIEMMPMQPANKSLDAGDGDEIAIELSSRGDNGMLDPDLA